MDHVVENRKNLYAVDVLTAMKWSLDAWENVTLTLRWAVEVTSLQADRVVAMMEVTKVSIADVVVARDMNRTIVVRFAAARELRVEALQATRADDFGPLVSDVTPCLEIKSSSSSVPLCSSTGSGGRAPFVVLLPDQPGGNSEMDDQLLAPDDCTATTVV
ncbi:hypothetical protein H257_17092 [Aphanomyces astaci]|uniref:Uncharacterized protein n=1 Tax=Aphanomyces astaci TaxID=112090 RepID=W4FG57_APHAT|nr:hypothetical protein H257_17092 [Aphanomyces astaci]ETV66425.1 hypothetical protein H257_17092 [Aphanomyces astaci]|eukprot:XP_009844059.1 hypothetical protein H257_17092 [Aphanomyces astaci]